MRIAESLRLAGLREHLDEKANSYVTSIPTLSDNFYSPTPMTVPGATTVVTEDLVELLKAKPLVLTTTNQNPTVPGAILVNIPNAGTLNDEWQGALRVLVDKATNGDKRQPIVTFAWCINRWNSRNLALRLVALGYTNVYWYRGGWEAWDAHDLPKAPLAMQFTPPR
jgi:rhodanese-related sulfurtransferase